MKKIHHGNEIELLQGGVMQPGPGGLPAEDVGCLDPGPFDGVRLATVDLIDHHVRLGPSPESLNHRITVTSDPFFIETLDCFLAVETH